MTFNQSNKKDLGLYIHIPFCVKKCDYCDFLSAPASQNEIEAYFEALFREIHSYRNRMDEYMVRSIFFGGGTPSSVDADYIYKTMEQIKQVFTIDENNLEASIEVNPGTLNRDKLTRYLDSGMNRISFGLQSVNNEELKLLGRIHTFEQFLENYKLAREVGFCNINIDLMSALPGQTLDSWEYTLNTVMELRPEHISAYSLIIEENTIFYDRYRPDSMYYDDLPDEEMDRLIYHKTKERLQEGGYHRYEISNYARTGYECRHNSSYWVGKDYLGIGLGSSSFINGIRWSNLREIDQYISLFSKQIDQRNASWEKSFHGDAAMDWINDPMALRQDIQRLTEKERMEEFMYLGLRMSSGISKVEFQARFNLTMDEVYGKVLEDLIEKKLIKICGDNIRLTEYGTDISNRVFAEFLFDTE